MRNKSTRQKGKKKFNFTKSKFWAQRYEEIWPAKVGKPWREKGGAHADRIWRLYCKGRPASKLTWCEPSGDHLDDLWRENIQRTSPQITGRAKAMTMLRLEKCIFRHTLGARTFYTSPLRKYQKTQRETFWLAIFRLFNVKWIILLHEKLLQFDWLRAVVFQLNLKYLHVKITNLCG